MADKYNKKKSTLTFYLYEIRQMQQSLFRGLSCFLINSSTRTPTFFGWIFLIGVTFLLGTYFLRDNDPQRDRENPDISEFRARKIVNPMLPQIPGPDMQEEEFKAVHENNMKGKGQMKFPRFDPNKHENVAHKKDDQEKVHAYGFPQPKAFPVKVVATPHDKCEDLILLLLVNSHPAQTGARLAIRRTWGTMLEGWTGPKWRTVFIVGRANTRFDKIAEDEARDHGDMLIGDFTDSPLEGTRKFMLAMKWTVDTLGNCMPQFVMKSDEKVFVNINIILPWLEARYTGKEGVYIGRVQRNDIPVRDPEDPHHVIRADFPPDTYPDYNQAPVYMFSKDVVITLERTMRTATPIAVEDAFVGILAKKSGIAAKHNDHFQMLRKPSNNCHFLHMFFMFNTLPNEHFQITKKIMDGKKTCGDVQIVDVRKGFHKIGNEVRGGWH